MGKKKLRYPKDELGQTQEELDNANPLAHRLDFGDPRLGRQFSQSENPDGESYSDMLERGGINTDHFEHCRR